jgi:hypothetical protein
MFWEEREHLVEDQVQKCKMDDVIFFQREENQGGDPIYQVIYQRPFHHLLIVGLMLERIWSTAQFDTIQVRCTKNIFQPNH